MKKKMKKMEVEGFSAVELKEFIKDVISESIAELKTNNPSQEEYLTRQEASELFKVTLPTIDAWRINGTLTDYKIGNRILFKRAEAEKAIKPINY